MFSNRASQYSKQSLTENDEERGSFLFPNLLDKTFPSKISQNAFKIYFSEIQLVNEILYKSTPLSQINDK